MRLVWFGGEKQGGGKKRGASAKGRNRSQQLSARLQALQKTFTARQVTTEAKESVVKKVDDRRIWVCTLLLFTNTTGAIHIQRGTLQENTLIRNSGTKIHFL